VIAIATRKSATAHELGQADRNVVAICAHEAAGVSMLPISSVLPRRLPLNWECLFCGIVGIGARFENEKCVAGTTMVTIYWVDRESSGL
jgi:hypothetical protein